MPTNPPPTKRRPGRRLAVVLAAGAIALGACSSDSDDSADLATTAAETSAPAESSAPETTAAPDTSAAGESDMGGDMEGASGPGCAAVPTDGEGSFSGMADDTAATAASNNPVLSTLVEAVSAADLVDTLNGEGPFTVFAPTNDAFAAIPADQLDAVLGDQDLLTSILTYHVVAGEQLSADDLVNVGSAATVNGAELTFTADGDQVEVNGAAVTICQDVPTANATVHIIDAVLMPS